MQSKMGGQQKHNLFPKGLVTVPASCRTELAMPLTKPILQFFREENLSSNKGYGLLRAGHVDSLMVEGRRVILLSSWADYLERQRRGLPRDPHDQARAVAEYRRTADHVIEKFGLRPRRRTAPPPIKTSSESAPAQRNLVPRKLRSGNQQRDSTTHT
jgi:hypothetical protein